jgi:hypothetical protein
MKLVKLDEVFVKLQEISNPGHPHDSYKCGSRGSGGSDRKKSKEEDSKKKNPIFDGRAGQHVTLGALNAESFCERVLSSVKLVVSDLHVSLKPSEIRIILRMNRGFMEYMRKTYPNTPLSEFRTTDEYRNGYPNGYRYK